MRASTWRTLGVLTHSIALCACTSLSVTAGDGSVSMERHWGFLNLSLRPNIDAMLVSGSSLGYMSGPAGVAVGATRFDLAALPQRCQVVFWVHDAEAFKAVQAFLVDRNGVCLIPAN